MPLNELEIQLKNSKTDKELKKVFKKIASKEPDKYFQNCLNCKDQN